MSFPSVIEERIYTGPTSVSETRTTLVGSYHVEWTARNLPITGKACLDSTIGGNNCEVISYYFSGHEPGNYIGNFRFFIDNVNPVAEDMEFYMRTEGCGDAFEDPSSLSDADIYEGTGWSLAPTADEGTANVEYLEGYGETDDPTQTEFIYFSPVVVGGAITGTASWTNKLIFQYT